MINYNSQTTKEQSLKYKKIKKLDHYGYYCTKYRTNQLKLTQLYCSMTQITNKFILYSTKLTYLNCSNTNITNKPIKYFTKLTYLQCINTQITLQSKGKLKVYK